MKRLLIAVFITVTLTILWWKNDPKKPPLTGRAMGSEWRLVTDENHETETLRAGIAATLEHWEQVLSTWRPESDISRYNRGEAPTADLSIVITLAEKLHHQSGGAFDHHMLAQLTAAGFGPGDESGRGMDLSSVGKGFAVDRVADFLAQHRIKRFAFSLAGEVRIGEGTWPVAIEKPDPSTPGIAETLNLSHTALATSGNYRLWNHRAGNKLASHILDPATNSPSLRPPCSVTVLGPDAASASGWATALFVLGPAGEALAKSHGYRVIWHGWEK